MRPWVRMSWGTDWEKEAPMKPRHMTRAAAMTVHREPRRVST